MLNYELNDLHLLLFKKITIVWDVKPGCGTHDAFHQSYVESLYPLKKNLMITRAIPFKGIFILFYLLVFWRSTLTSLYKILPEGIFFSEIWVTYEVLHNHKATKKWSLLLPFEIKVGVKISRFHVHIALKKCGTKF